MNARKELPAPDMTGTDIQQQLSKRISLAAPIPIESTPIGGPYTPIPGPHQGMGTNGESAPAPSQRKTTRQDAPGMRRTSLYISADAADALDTAARQVQEVIGGDIPRHAALSALILAGAAQVDTVAQQLISERAAALTERLAQLKGSPTPAA